MSTTIFLGGRFLSPDEAKVSAFDAGFQHAIGLFETMLGGVGGEANEPWVFRMDEHLERLKGSAAALGLSDSLRVRALGDAVIETVKRSGLARARVRLTITGGDLNMLSRGEAADREPTLMIVAQPATEYPAPMFERGVAAVFADARANPLNPFEGHKTLNYWWRLRELQAAAAKGAAEAIVLQVTNHAAGGCVSNLFVVKDGALLSPIARGEEAAMDAKTGAARGLPSPVLPGVVRAWVIERAEREGMTVQRRMLSAADIMDADEVLLTNSSWGVLPVVKVEAEAIGDGVVGAVGKRLREGWVGETVG